MLYQYTGVTSTMSVAARVASSRVFRSPVGGSYCPVVWRRSVKGGSCMPASACQVWVVPAGSAAAACRASHSVLPWWPGSRVEVVRNRKWGEVVCMARW